MAVRRGSPDPAVSWTVSLPGVGDLRSAKWQGQETLPQLSLDCENSGKLFPARSIVYDNVTQCFGHELLSGAMRFSEKTNDRLHWLRTEGPGTSRLQGNLSGHCRLMGAQSLTCLEYFARRLIRSVRPDRVRFVQSIDDGVSSGGFSQT